MVQLSNLRIPADPSFDSSESQSADSFSLTFFFQISFMVILVNLIIFVGPSNTLLFEQGIRSDKEGKIDFVRMIPLILIGF